MNVDYSKAVTHLEFAAGYGGIGLGLERVIANICQIAYVEIEAFAVSNLVPKMEAGLLPAAPVWTDIKTFPSSEFYGIVDILSAGYPCQPFSNAGRRKGKQDPRHLWPYIRAATGVIQPKCCFFENVEGHISLGLSAVLSDLGELGYEVEAGIFSAEEVGAPHQRKRVFILGIRGGYELADAQWLGWRGRRDEDAGRQGRALQASGPCSSCGETELADGEEHRVQGCGACGEQELPAHAWQRLPLREGEATRNCWPARPNEVQPRWEPPRVVGNDASGRTGKSGNSPGERKRPRPAGASGNDSRQKVESSLGGDADGDPGGLDDAKLYESGDNRTDELRMCGNGVVPATAAKAFITLYDKITE